MDKLYIVMPAYNEEANIETVVGQWHPVVAGIGKESKLVIVDDGSKDSTYRELVRLSEKYTQLTALTKKNSGHGATCLYAYRYAITEGADYIFQTDSDGQTDPVEFASFWEQRKNYDFLIGARKKRQDGRNRIWVTRVLKLVLWFVFGQVVEDANTPFRLMNARCLHVLLKQIPENFFLANVLISVLALRGKMKVLWIPITFKPRQGGVNSINFKRIVRIGIRSVRDLRKVKRQLNRR